MSNHAPPRQQPVALAPSADASGRGRSKARLTAVAAAALAALTVWALVELVLGIDLRAPAWVASQPNPDIAAGNVLVAAVAASLGGWALLAVLERWTARSRQTWAVIATLVAIGSSLAPLSGAGITTVNRAVLVLLHLVVGAVLVPLLYRTSSERPR